MILLWYWRYSSYYCKKFASVYDAACYAYVAEEAGSMFADHIEVDGKIPDLTEVYRQIEEDFKRDEDEYKSQYVEVDGWVLSLRDTKGTKQSCVLASSQYKDELEEQAKEFDPSRVIIEPSTISVRVSSGSRPNNN